MIDTALYYFTPSALTISINTQTGEGGFLRSETCSVSAMAGAAVKVSNQLKTQAGRTLDLGYNAQLEYRQFTFVGYNTIFGYALNDGQTEYRYREAVIRVYIRLDASNNGSTGELIFLPYEVDYDGRLLLPEGVSPVAYEDIALETHTDQQGNPYYTLANSNPDNTSGLSFYYIHIATISAPENGLRSWLQPVLSGQLETAKGYNEDNTGTWAKMFRLSPSNIIEVLLPFDKLSFNASGNAFINRIITTTAETIDGFTNWANENGMATTASIASYISAHLKTLDDKFFRKDIPDTSPHLATFGSVKIEKGLPVPSEGGEMPSTGTLAVEGNATFEKDIVAEGKVMTDFIQSTSDLETLDTLFGEGFLMKILNGKAHLFTDFLTVRMKAIFAELEIRKLSYVGGSIVLTPSGGQVAHVVEMKEGNVVVGYKCYMTADDGSMATTNSFAVGDQARCQTFNLDGAGKYTDVSNKYYWRLVVEAGQERVDESFHVLNERDEGYEEAKVTNYVVLSNRVSETMDGLPYKGYDDSAENDVPAQGDTIVGMGNQKSPTERGNIIMLRTVDESGGDNAPSATLYRGVGASPNPYSLIGKDILHFSPSDGFTVLADFFQIRSNPTTPPTPINQYVGIHLIECSTLLVSTNTINAAEPTVLGGQMVSTLYAVQLGEYLLKMGEESEGSTAVIKCRAALQSYNARTYVTGTLVAKNMRGSEEISTIESSNTGELLFAYSQIDMTCDCIKVTLTIDGEEKAVASIGIVKDGKDGADAEFDELEDVNSYARIYFSDEYNQDGSLQGTDLKLNVSISAMVKHVAGDGSSMVSDLSDYTLTASYSYNNLIHTINIPASTGIFSYDNTSAQPGGQGYIAISSSLIGTISKTLTLTLSKGAFDIQWLEIPITLDENQTYTRTKKVMESMYASGGDISVIRQTASNLALQVGQMGDGLFDTGIDIEHKTITFTANNLVCKNNENEKTMWLNAVGTLGVSGNIYTGSCNINTAQRLAQYFRTDTVQGVNTTGESAQIQGSHCLLSYISTNNPWGGIWNDYGGTNVVQVADIFRLTDLVVFNISVDFSMDGKVLLLPYIFPIEARQGQGTTPVVRYDVCRTATDYKTDEEHLNSLDELRMLVGKEFTIMNDSGEYMEIYVPDVYNGTVRHGFNQFHDTAGYTFKYVCEEFTIPYGAGELQHVEGIYPKLVNTFKRLLEPIADDFTPKPSTDN